MRILARTALALTATLALTVAVAPAAHARPVIDSDLGTPTVMLAGKPVWGSLQNLPGLGVTEFTTVGPGMAGPIEHYYESGQAKADQRMISEKGRALVRLRLDETCGGNPRACDAMVVFDIDETLLSNYSYYDAHDPKFTGDDTTWLAYSKACGQSVNAPVLKLYRQVQRLGVKTAIVTGRPVPDRSWTRDCLRERGVSGWSAFVFKPTDVTANAARWKASVRGDLQQQGYTILASVGDQLSDMAHGRMAGGIWLPNPMYYIP